MPLLNFQPIPADPLLGLMTAFREDRRASKVDLGVGVYRDAAGQTPIMKAVKSAELKLQSSETSKAYEGPRGNPQFCAAIEQLVFGSDLSAYSDRIASLATPGGCGALYLGVHLAKRANPTTRVWISDPSWANHKHIIESAGLEVKTYRYLDHNTYGIDWDGMIEDLAEVKRGDVVIFQGPCHNPTGVDMLGEQWVQLAELALQTGFIPFVDIAYHGLGDGLDLDLTGVQKFLTGMPEALISYSCSKNFGLYKERTGCLLVIAASSRDAAASSSHLADISRASYSMPPAHGAAVVGSILNDPDLQEMWRDELFMMQSRIADLRTRFAQQLSTSLPGAGFERIASEKGMFSLIPVRPADVDKLVGDFGIYLPHSGRINMAGLSVDIMDYVLDALQSVLQPS